MLMLDEKLLAKIEGRAAMSLADVMAIQTSDDFTTPTNITDHLPRFGTDPCTNERSTVKAERQYVFRHELLARECEEWSASVHENSVTLSACMDLLAGSIREAMPTQTDGLAAEWVGSVWCNFPYSDPLPWCDRLAAHDDTWVALAKLDTTTRWWARLMDAGAEWAPFRARQKFGQPGKDMTANFPSVLIWRWWDPPTAIAKQLWWKSYGVYT